MHNCEHNFTAIRWRNKSAGLIGYQCVECGERVGPWLKHASVKDIDSIEDWKDLSTPQPANDDRIPLLDLESRVTRYINREHYQNYLQSDAWKRRRAKVFERAGGVCEGCLTNPATQVHHITYTHIFREFAFELVALCNECHQRIHSDSSQASAG